MLAVFFRYVIIILVRIGGVVSEGNNCNQIYKLSSTKQLNTTEYNLGEHGGIQECYDACKDKSCKAVGIHETTLPSGDVLKCYFFSSNGLIMITDPQVKVWVKSTVDTRSAVPKNPGLSCPSSFPISVSTITGTSCYFESTTHINWAAADNFCTAINGHLAS